MTPPAAAVRVVRFEEIDSTNAEARRRAEAGEAGPLVLVAARQTAGRGRRGRAWETGAGNLAATYLVTVDKQPAEAALISFVAGLAGADLVAESAPQEAVWLKWPNDVMINDEKVAGVLVESGRATAGGLWLAIGLGVNLMTPPAAAERPATAVSQRLRADVSAPPSPEEALDRLSIHLMTWIRLWEEEGTPAILAAWVARARGLGGPCQARLDREVVEGTALGLDEDGALRLRLMDGSIRRITAGDVFFSDPAALGAH